LESKVIEKGDGKGKRETGRGKVTGESDRGKVAGDSGSAFFSCGD